MSDELDIPPFGYRAAYRRGPDPGTRRMAWMAGGFAAALLVVVGGYSLLDGGGPGTVPTIAAPAGPVKVRPANPGGLQVSQTQNPSLGAVAAGDLTRRLRVGGDSAMGELAASLNLAIENMHSTVVALAEGTRN
ncbi:MAG: hypothetical protein ACP5NI_04470, partial [Acetobacteraceae bacterium]